jgi:hypothetical protein
MLFKSSASVIAILAASFVTAQAQDWEATPAYGSRSLEAGFREDPTSIPVRAGGAISANQVDANCYGYITHQPSFNLNYEAGSFELFLSAASDTDAVLVVNAPDGSWHCNDDAPGNYGLNPGVSFSDPLDGLYNIWVGSLSSGSGFEPAMLHISELSFSNENVYSRAPNALLTPHAGQLNLTAGFADDPRDIAVQAGGDIDVSRVTGGQCYGTVSEAPDVWLDYSASDAFDLYVSMVADVDTTLAILAPSGDWHCDDDTAGDLNPGVHISDPETGRYAVWAARYSDGPLSDATLFVSELGFQGVADEPDVLDFSLPSNYGSTDLVAGFSPDPYNVDLQAGGGVDVFAAVGQGCRGFASMAPDYDLTYEAGQLDLYLSATSDGDTTIIVNAPDGSWHCNDDGAGNLNPGVHFDQPLSGRYDIWVGTYNEGGLEAATLHISELGFGDEYHVMQSLDFALPSNFGDVSLEGGFLPDPHSVDLIAGGPIAVERAVGGRCLGYVTEAPDYELSFVNGELPLYISASSDADTTLLINGPDGTWHCNDDNEGFNPGIEFEEPGDGVYDIWVGTYSEIGGAEATLSISELGFEYD